MEIEAATQYTVCIRGEDGVQRVLNSRNLYISADAAEREMERAIARALKDGTLNTKEKYYVAKREVVVLRSDWEEIE